MIDTRDRPILEALDEDSAEDDDMNIQLIYAHDCPNTDAARAALRQSLEAECLPVRFQEIDVADPATPEHLRGWGSPTILVDGLDVGGDTGPTGPCCRLYDHGNAYRGAPSHTAIVEALRRARIARLPPAPRDDKA